MKLFDTLDIVGKKIKVIDMRGAQFSDTGDPRTIIESSIAYAKLDPDTDTISILMEKGFMIKISGVEKKVE